MSRERRIHPRTVTRIRATLRCGDAEMDGVVENLGAGGVFYSTGDLEAAVEVGDPVTVVLHPDGASDSSQDGRVLRAERYFDGAHVRRSFAVKFDAEIDVASLDTGA
jgi:hypothetical protein